MSSKQQFLVKYHLEDTGHNISYRLKYIMSVMKSNKVTTVLKNLFDFYYVVLLEHLN
ncbi:hypothetical protein DSUL_100140 [Desulfovibrionales bacterium]